VDHQLDSANSLKLTANASKATNTQQVNSQSKTFNVDKTLKNESARETFNKGDTWSLNSNLLWRHKFSKKGRTLSTNLTLNASRNTSDGTQYSTNDFYGPVNTEKIIDQTNNQLTSNQTAGVNLSYTEPLGGRKYLEASYNYRINRNEVDREVFNRVNGAQEKDMLLSNEYTSNYTFNRPGLNFRLVRQKFNLTLGTSYQMTRLRGDLISKNAVIDRTFRNMLPVARVNYDFSTFRHLRLDYETSMREPSIQQLQPVIDNTDPLNISVGNPELKPAYAHNLNLNFTTFDPAKFMNFFAFLTAVYQTNAITYSQTVDQRLVRTTKPVNVKDNLNLNGNINFGFPVKVIKSRFNLGPNASYSRSVNVLNEQESQVFQKSYGGNVRYNFNLNDVFTLDLSANIRDQISEFDAAPQQNQEFINQTYSAETSVTIRKKYQFNSSYDYYRYDSKTTSFSQSIPILNLWLSRFVMKGNAGELKVGVSNLLNRNLGVSQTATVNYLQQETINNLGRYFMVSFTYALNRQLNPFGGGGGGGRRGGGGGMRMMMMRTDQ